MNKKSNVKISISGDEYQAHMTIAHDPGESLSLKDLGPILLSHGVVSGIKKEVLINIVDKYKKGTGIDNVLVAEGTRPFEGVKPGIEYKFEVPSPPGGDDPGCENHRKISKIANITRGRLLAVKQKLKPPIDGITVTGRKTTFLPLEDISLEAGDHVETEEQGDFLYYKAAAEGTLKLENNTLSVIPILEIKGDVDSDVGNIRFKGDVKIERDVLQDFVVETAGSISISGSAVACKLIAAEGIEVKAGIVGKNKSEAISGDNITAAFVENAKLIAGYDITIKSGIIGSEIHCSGVLKMENSRSRIVGSTIQAARGIFVYNVGSRFDTSSQLITGFYPGKEKEFLKIKELMDTHLNEAKEIEKKYGRPALEKKDSWRILTPQIREDIARWESLKKELLVISQRLKQTEDAVYDHQAVIQVQETLYPRVFLRIGRYHLVTDREYYNVRIRCSRQEPCLLIE